jgi:hypothetical protein
MDNEVEILKAEIARLKEELDIAKIDIEVLAFEVQALEKQRADDVKRLAGIERSR